MQSGILNQKYRITEMTKKQKDILKAGKELLYRYGIKKVSVEDICKEANVSKMTFYKYFPNKTELVKSVVDELYSYWIDRYKAMLQSDLPPDQKMKKVLEYKIESARNMESAFFIELYIHPDDSLKSHLDKWTKIRLDLAAEWFKQMQQDGQITKEITLPVFLLFSNAMQEFALREDVIQSFPDMGELTKIISRLLLYGIAER